MPLVSNDVLRQLLDKSPNPRDSMCIESLGEYNPETGDMIVNFQQRGSYRYFNVPIEVFVEFGGAYSMGTYFNLYIRDQYSFERIS